MSDSVRPHRRQPTRLPCPWDSPGTNTGVGCHFLLQCMKEKSESEVAQSCLTLRDPMDCSLPGSSVHGIFQARELEWGAIAFSSLSNLLKYRIDSFLSVSTCLDNLAVALLCWKILLEHNASSQIFFLWVKYFLGKQGTSKQQHFFSKLHCTRKKKFFLNLLPPDSHLCDGQVTLCFNYFLTNDLTFYSITPYLLSSRPSTLNDRWILTFGRDHVAVQKKLTQHCKAIILQLK